MSPAPRPRPTSLLTAPRFWLWRYGLALAAVVAAVLLTLLLRPLLNPAVAPLFTVAVGVSAWCGGRGPGLMAALLSVLSLNYFFLAPLDQFTLSLDDLARLAVFTLIALLIGWLKAELREAESVLRASEERYRDLILNADDVIYTLDLDGNVTSINPAIERIAGYRPEDLLGRPISGIVPPTFHPTMPRMLERKLTGEGRTRYELETIAKDGRILTIEINSRLLTVGGKPAGIQGIARDITARKQAEAERDQLLAREQAAHVETEIERQRLRGLILQAPAAMCIMRGPEHVFELVNATYQQAIGGRDPIGKAVREARSELEGQGLFELLDEVYRTGEPYVGTEVPVQLDRRGDGTLDLAYFNFVYHPLRTANGTVDGILVQGVEVTDQVCARQQVQALADALTVERDRLQQVLDVLPEAVLIADATPTFVIDNQAARAILGMSPVGQPVPLAGLTAYEAFGARRLDGTPYPAEELPLGRALLRGENVLGEQLFLRNARGGQDVPVLANAAPLRDPTGAISGGIVVFQDITAIKELEQAREQFLAAASHDLKNPIMAIRGIAQLAQRRVQQPDADPEKLTAQMHTIILATSRMSGLLDELLDSARLQLGQRLELRSEPLDLVALAQQAVAESQPTTERHELRVEAATPHLLGRGDAARLERVLTNLLSNAIKYSPNGGEIVVSVARETDTTGAWAILAVRDPGLGIPAADLPYVFERFRRASNVGVQIKGVGLGLANARQIVELHGGTIAVDSQEGRGTTVTIRLPRPSHQTP